MSTPPKPPKPQSRQRPATGAGAGAKRGDAPDPGLLRPAGSSFPPSIAAPLDLAQVPFVLALQRLPGRDAPRGGHSDAAGDEETPEAETDERDAEALERLPVLPGEAWQARYDIVERFGRTLTVRVEGHSRLGMPRGRDLDVFLAVLALYGDDYQQVLAGRPSRLQDGALADVSVNEILGAMGIPADDRNGTASRRVRQALRRFAYLTFTATGRVFRDAEGEAAALLAGSADARPTVPDRGTGGRRDARDVLTVDEEVTHLLEYRWQLNYARSPAGELRITRLKLNPRFHEHLVTGWVAWIEDDRYRALTSPLARRLYVLLAGEAATGRSAPWAFDLRALRAACGMSPRRYANEVKKDLVRAAEELASAGVLAAGAEAMSPKKGEWTITFEPGPALALAALLRGTSVLDLSSSRAQLAFLHYFGFDDGAARTLLADRPNAVYDALCFALYVRETEPGRVTRSWRGFITDRVVANRPNSGEVGYAAWAAKRLAPPGQLPSASPSAAPQREPSPPAPPSHPPRVLPSDAVAAAVWAELLGVLPASGTAAAVDRQLVGHLVPIEVAGDTLVVGTDLLFAPSTVRRVREALALGLEVCASNVRASGSGGVAPTRLRIEHVVPSRDGATIIRQSMLGGVEDRSESDSATP